MKKILALIVMASLFGCNDSKDDLTPKYVKDAKSDISAAIISNIIRNPDFSCESIPANDNIWSMGCFIKVENPSPFLLFAVYPDDGTKNPPFHYKLYAVNGKAKQYANYDALKMFKIDTSSNISTNIDEVRRMYIEHFVTNVK